MIKRGHRQTKVSKNKKITLSQRWPRDAPNIWLPWKLYVSGKSADIAQESSHYNLITIRRWSYFRSIPTNVITAPNSDLNVTDGQTVRHCRITVQ